MIRKVTLVTAMAASFMAVSLSGQKGKSHNDASVARTLTGVVSDSMCGAEHMAKDKTAAQCTRECVKGGSDYALVVGKQVYVLKGNNAEIDKFAGERVTVKGSLSGNTATVESIVPARKETKN